MGRPFLLLTVLLLVAYLAFLFYERRYTLSSWRFTRSRVASDLLSVTYSHEGLAT